MGNLTALAVKNAKPGDKLGDGDGLRLDVDKNGNASWLFRFKSPVTGKERFMGLGPLRDVGLADAREAKGAAGALLRNNIDPIEHRIAERAKVKADATAAITFEFYAKRYIAGKEAGWKNDKHRQQWSNSLRELGRPIWGSRKNKALITFTCNKVSQGTFSPIHPKSIVVPIDDAAACRRARQAASLTYILAQSPAPSNAAAAR
jgi:hypothetical protein